MDAVQTELADEVGVQPVQRLDGEGFDFVVDDGPSHLAQAAENAFNDHKLTFADFYLSEADNFDRTGLVLQEESISRLSLTVRRQLNIRHLSGDDDIPMVVLLRMRQQFRDFNQADSPGS